MSRGFRKRFWSSFVWSITLLAMVLNTLFPAFEALRQVRAQEVTPEPAPEVTAEATADPTQEITAEPTVEVTADTTPTPIVEATLEVTADVATETPLPALPTLPPPTAEVSLFVDNFQDAGTSLVTNGWSLSSGWTIGSEAGSDGTTNFYLSATPTGVNETAALPQIQWADLTLASRVRVGGNDAAAITVRAGIESYTVFITGSGAVQLYRGAVIVAEGPVVVTPEPVLPGTDATAEAPVPAVWRTVNIQVENDTITVLLEGVPQISYTDPTPVGAGSIGFSAGSLNAGTVDFDDIVISRLLPPVVPTVEATAEVTAEATAEATVAPDGVLLREDFQTDLAQWNFSTDAGIVAAGDEGNQVLLMPSAGTLTPLNALVLGDLRLDARVNLVTTENGGVQITLRDGYTLTIGAAQTTLARGETVLATSEAAREAGTWYAVSVTMERDHFVVSVNDTVEIDVIDSEPTLAGGIGFSAVGVVQIDDIVVTDLTSQAVLAEVTPSPTPVGIDEETRVKIDGALVLILNTFMSGDLTAFAEEAATYGIFVDDSGRVRVVLRAANLASGETLRATIEGTGGIVERVVDNNVTALISPMGIIAIAGTPEVEVVLLPDAPVSADYSSADSAAVNEAMGSVIPQSLDIISVPDWDAAAIRGADIDIAVIDSSVTGGFTGGGVVANRACLLQAPAGPTAHGAQVAEVLCDVAPSARVYGFLAGDAATLTTTINNIRNASSVAGIPGNTYDIILITLDLGANASAGDGTGVGLTPTTDFYAAIEAARTSGIFVVASAGNNNGRYQSFTLAAGANGTVNITAPVGARVNISWSAWGVATDVTATLAGTPKLTRGGATNPAGYSFAVTTANPQLSVTNPSGGALTIQVQVTGATSAITAGGTAVFLNTTGNLARPADSPDVIAVGAVCANQSARYPRLSDSSIGPVFSAGGVGPNNSTAGVDIKPDLVAPSHVSTSMTIATDCVIPGTVGANNIATPVTGFNGTSAAAAHVAGMAALLRSNTINNSMNTRVGPGLQNAPAEIERYLQTHTVDLYTSTISAGENPPAGLPDGWDRTFGAGLTMLGSPTFNLADVQNYGNASTHDGTTFYVGQANLNSTQVGDSTNPYLSIAEAIQDRPGQRVVVMSGEYVSGINVGVAGTSVVSYDSADIVNRPDTAIWVNDTFFNVTAFGGSSAGINVNDVNNVTIDGFVFNAAHPLYITLNGPAPIWGIPRAVAGNAVAGFTLQNNAFNGFNAGVTMTIDGTTTVTGNTFTNFNLPPGSFETSVLGIIGLLGSGGDDVVNVTTNTFSGNVNAGGSTDDNLPRQAIAYLSYARINFYSNRMYNNRAEAMVTINQWEDVVNSLNNHTRSLSEARIFSSSFTNNQIINGDALSVINLFQGAQFRFVNNTIAGTDMSLGNRAAFINIGGTQSPQNHFDGGLDAQAQFLHEWEIHNNLFYNNTFGGSGTSRSLIGFPSNLPVNLGCFSIGAPGLADQGAHNNWFIYKDFLDNDASRPNLGQCDDALAAPANGNVFDELANASAQTTFESANFFGVATDPIDPYRLRPTSTHGIDGGVDAYVTGIFDNPLTVPVDIQPDVLRLTRIVTRIGGGQDIDLGAYELSDPQPLVVTGDQLVTGAEDTPFIPFQLGAGGVVTGGILPLRYSVNSAPANYNASATGPCSGVPIQYDAASNQAAYCPPPDFYSYPAGGGIVTFTYTVTDALGEASTTGRVNINVTSVGDNVDDGGLFGTVAAPQTVFTSVLTPTNYRLRPYVDFNNFRLSDPTTERGQDYPFTFSNAQFVSGSATLLGADQTATMAAVNAALTNANSNGGYLVVSPIPGNTGELVFTYNVSDGTGQNFANAGRVRLIITQRLAGIGLHDDVSLDFVYTGAWAPYYFETANNNSMHFTSTLDDQIDFYYNGDTFILNMYGLPSSGNFEISIDPDGDTGAPFQSPAALGLTCSPEINPTTGIVAGVRPAATFYSIGCRGLDTTSANTVHILRIKNKSAGKFLFIDSIEIRGSYLAGGYYEERDFSLNYTGTWVDFASASGPKGGSERYSLTLGSTITFQYNAATSDAIAIYYSTVARWGTMRVCASGGACININQNSTAIQWGKRRWISDTELNIGGSTGVHTITISPTIGGQVIGIEALYIHSQPNNSLGAALPASPTPYEDVNSALRYIGRWSFLGNPQTFGGSAQVTNDPSASVMFNIDSSAYGIAVYRTTSAGWANMEICIDDVCQTFNNGGSTVFGDTAVLRVGSPGPHVVEIRNTAALYLDVEAIRVLGAAGPLGLGFYEETEASTDFNLVYTGPWINFAAASVVGGTARYTLSTAASIGFQVDAQVVDRIGIYRIQSPTWSDFNVCASGGTCVLVDNNPTYSAFGRLVVISLDDLGIGASTLVHTITIRSVTNGRASGVEAFELRGPQGALAPGYYEEKQLGTNLNLLYGGTWLDVNALGPRNGSLRYASSTTSNISFTYDPATSDGIAVYYPVAVGWGTLKVCPGAAPCININEGGAPLNGQRRWFTQADLGNPVAPITITLSPLANGPFVGIDALYVHAASNGLGTLAASPTPYEETNSAFRYVGTWTSQSLAQYFGGSSKYSNDPSASIMFNIDASATGIAVYRTTGPVWGSIEICIDTVCQTYARRNITVYSDIISSRVETPGPHLVEIRNVGPTFLGIEAIRVLGPTTPMGIGFYEDTEASANFNMTYGGNWQFLNIVGMVGNNAHYTTSSASSLSFDIDTNVVKRIILFRGTGPTGWSNFEVCAEGVTPCYTVNNTSSVAAYGVSQIITLANLSIVANGVYTITIKPTTDATATIEALQLTGAPSALGPGYYDATEIGSNFNMTYTGTWTNFVAVGPRGGSERYTSNPASEASFDYNGTTSNGLMIYFTKSAGRGQLEVCGTICASNTDQNNATTLWAQRRWFTEAELGIAGAQNYTITISSATNGLNAGIDAFYIHGDNSIGTPLAISGTPYQDNNSSLRYLGTWTTSTFASFNGGTAALTTDPSAAIMFNIDSAAAGIAIYRTTTATAGPTEICIDNSCQSFSGVGPVVFGDTSALWRGGIAGGQHLVEIRSTTALSINVEAIQVVGAFSPLAIGYYEETGQSTGFNLTYTGPWSNWVNAGALGGTARLVTSAGAAATFRVDANTTDRIVIFHTNALNWGTLNVCSQLVGGFGNECVPINTNAATTVYGVPTIITNEQLGIDGSTNVHNITITSQTVAPVNIEAIQILGAPANLGLGYYEETEIATSFNLTYNGAWSTLTTPAALGGTARYTNSTAATATFTIDSSVVTRLAIFRTTGPGWSDMQVCNGATCLTAANNVGTAALYRVPYLINTADLGAGVFTVTIKSVTQGAPMAIDALQLLGPAGPLAPGYYDETEASTSFGLTYNAGWTSLGVALARGGSIRYANSTASTITFTYDTATSDGFILYHPSLTTWGDMSVCSSAVTGNCQTVDQNSVTGWNKRTWIDEADLNMTAGIYTITIRPSTNGGFAGIDGIYINGTNALGTPLTVNSTPYEENNPSLRYIGTWTTQNLAQFVGGSARRTADAGASVMFNIDASARGVAVYRTSGPGWGSMEVCVDDQCQIFPPTLSLVYGDIVFVRLAAPVAVQHVVEIKTIGVATPIDVEAVRVLGAETPLAPGFYQENDPNVLYTGAWTTFSSTLYNGGTVRQSKTPNDTINFSIGGGASGFVIFTTRGVGAANMEVCYRPTLPALGTQVCVTENTNNPVTQFTFGFATFGLNHKQLAPNQANDQVYNVSIRHAGTALQPLSIEAIAVVGVPTTTLPIGTYDDAAPGIVYSPSPLWVSTAAAVYLNSTVHYSFNAGALVQLRFTGNSITVYQLAAAGLAPNVNACLVIPVTTGNQLRCVNFSQRNTVNAFGTPITVYGFGFGTHDFVLENAGGSAFIVDSIQIR